MNIRTLGIVYHPRHEGARQLAERLCLVAGQHGAVCWLESAWDSEALKAKAAGSDLIVTVGGDGTILRAAQAVMPHLVPLLGVNMGQLGFMTELSGTEAPERLPEILAGRGWRDERGVLEARKVSAEADVFYALNDVVVSRGSLARLIQFSVAVDAGPSVAYKADGVIVATATGSTGYSLAAGGPVVYPGSADILLTPILPHPERGYSYVLPSSSVVKITVGRALQASLTIDGHVNLSVSTGDVIEVRRSQYRLSFLRLHPPRPALARPQLEFKESC